MNSTRSFALFLSFGFWMAACGETGGTASVGGEGGAAQGGAAQGGAAQGGAAQGGAAQGGSGGGAPSAHCPNAIHCGSVQGYFCYEVSTPAPDFEAECTNDLGGAFGQGPCGPEYADGGCLFDCATPSVYSVAVGIDQTQCEMDGGTYVANP
jgi:hypothetical protein